MFVIALRDNLIKNVDELESWHTRFDPSWWLLLRLKNPSADMELASETTSRVEPLATPKTLTNELAAQETKIDSALFEFLEENALFDDREIIPYSKLTLTCLEGSWRYVIMDTVVCNPHGDPAVVMRDVENLAKIDSSRFGLLSCHGTIKHQKPQGSPSVYDLLFNIPPDTTATRSLRGILIGEPTELLSTSVWTWQYA